jgi:hypothetical protein
MDMASGFSSSGRIREERPRRRGIALIMVLMVTASLLILGMLFAGSVTAEYRAAVYYRQAAQAEQFCLVGLHRAMGELMYDVWGVSEDRPFGSARYNPKAIEPEENLLPLAEAAYYESGSGGLKPIVRQRGFWNGEAWVVWAGDKVTPPPGFTNVWNMDPRPETRPEIRGGAQRYLSYGASSGRLTCTRGNSYVHGDGRVHFNVKWPPGTEIFIAGESYNVEAVIDQRNLILKQDYRGRSGRDLSWHLPGDYDCPPSADSPPTFPGGAQGLREFLDLERGYAADPRWVSPARFIRYLPANRGEAWRWGGVDINGDGQVTAVDKSLRDWALWQLRCDAFLPEAGDNHDLFQAGLHANNRRLWPNGTERDNGWEFIDPKIVGDSFYLIFRSDPLYSFAPGVSGDPDWSMGMALDGGAGGRTDRAGFRYPYDRTHLGRWRSVSWADDACGGLVNINACNNDADTEQWTDLPTGDAPTSTLARYSYPEAKWIYCYEPSGRAQRRGRYAVTVMPDCGTWNAAVLHCGNARIVSEGKQSYSSSGAVAAAGSFVKDLRRGFHPRTGEPTDGTWLSAHGYAAAPIRPTPLPAYWSNVPAGGKSWYYCADTPGGQDRPQESYYPPVDYSRAQEVLGAYTGKTRPLSQPYVGLGLRVPIYNYRVWLGPYASRAEFATHLRKACLVVFNPSYAAVPEHCGRSSNERRCMEERDTSASARALVAADARLISSLSSVHAYSYTLDRFWERSLLVLEAGGGAAGSRTDPRFATPQSASGRRLSFTTSARRPSQKIRRSFIQELRDLECSGGYRTRDGSFRLLDYLFAADVRDYDPDMAPQGCAPGVTYGRAGPVQQRASRLEKFLALTASRTACMLRGGNARLASCSRGHLLRDPRVDAWHQPVWTGYSRTRNQPRTSSADPTVDDLAEGCPVCGGRLFLAQLGELFINEVGRFREKFRNAERPVRQAFDLSVPGAPPARHFVELMVHGYRGYTSGLEGSEDLVRFDNLSWHASSAQWARYPGVLCDPVTQRPYFTARYDFDMRWRAPSTQPGSMDPEPVFRELGHVDGDDGSQWDLRLLAYVEGASGGRWHDVTWFMGGGRSFVREVKGGVFELRDAALYDGRHRSVSDDAAPDSRNWGWHEVRADELYTMPDPDPAHQQAAEGEAWGATVSIYRKMPVRWYGGDRRHPYDMEYVRLARKHPPLGKWIDDYAKDPSSPGAQPAHALEGRGVGFDGGMRLSYAAHGDDDELWSYRGDYSAAANPGGWPGPTRRDGAERLDPGDELGSRDGSPRQYAVISFDARFDAKRLALMRCARARKRPKYTSWRLIDYVELADSAGRGIPISAACGRADPRDPSKVLSWQCRNPLDNRSNADGFLAWDLLPMTLQNSDHGGALDGGTGYDPWRVAGVPAGCGWWGNGGEAAAVDRVANPNPLPPGYRDLAGLVCNSRNSNSYVRDVPLRRREWTGSRAAVEKSRALIARLKHAHLDNATGGKWTREANRKECTLSIPTGVGRQLAGAGARAKSPSGAGDGRQQLVLPGYSWSEGASASSTERSWAAYSWSDWSRIYRVTDLCEKLLWDLGDEAEHRDFFDADGDGRFDYVSGAALSYSWEGGEQEAASGRFCAELKALNRINLNEVRAPAVLVGLGWKQLYAGLGRKPLRGFNSAVDAGAYNHFDASGSGYQLRIKPWDLDDDQSLDRASGHPGDHDNLLRAARVGSSPVYTIVVTGASLDEHGEVAGERRLRATVERTWDGRLNILEFNWLRSEGESH